MGWGGCVSALAVLAVAGCAGLETSGTSDVFPAVDASIAPPDRDASARPDAPLLFPPDGGAVPQEAGDDDDGAVASDASGCGPASPSPSPIVARQLAAPPKLDGDLSEWPCNAMVRLDAADAAHVAPSADAIHGVFAVAWDSGHVYLGAHVVDPNVVATNADVLWTNSAVELYVSGTLASTGDIGPQDHQYIVDAANRAADYAPAQSPPNMPARNPAGVAWAARPDGDGFTVEIAITPSTMALATFSSGSTLGFDVELDDGDGTNQLGSLVWAVATRGACTCTKCCCGTSYDLPFCDVLRYGKLTLQ